MNKIISLLFTIFIFIYAIINIIILKLIFEFFILFNKNITINRYVDSEALMLIRDYCNDFINHIRRK